MKEKLTKTMQHYVELDKQIKTLEAEKKKLKAEVVKEFEDNPDKQYSGLTFFTQQRVDFKYPEFYNWVKESFPDHLNDCREEKINESKFEELWARGKIEYDEIPENAFTMREIQVIRRS